VLISNDRTAAKRQQTLENALQRASGESPLVKQRRVAWVPLNQVRYYLCRGSWHGPHACDIELRHVVDTMPMVNAV
jgi:hypothetical protein